MLIPESLPQFRTMHCALQVYAESGESQYVVTSRPKRAPSAQAQPPDTAFYVILTIYNRPGQSIADQTGFASECDLSGGNGTIVHQPYT
jgi:hypothetical protein